jgi:hypothetical protein
MKNYKNWCDLKYKINKSERFLSFYAKEIWWCSLGLNIGYEQDGKNKNMKDRYWFLRNLIKISY